MTNPLTKSVKRILGACIFLSAFLLFQIQPIIGKFLLPYYGGTAAVWSVCLVFFMTLLIVGYIYAYALTRLRPINQVIIHLTLVFLTVIYVLFSSFFETASISHLFSSAYHNIETPFLSVIIVLITAIGIPYFLLSTTSTLIQSWVSKSQVGERAYNLYAISNFGSFLGLLSYPFLFEPWLGLGNQVELWTYLFIILAILLVASSVAFLRLVQGKESKAIVSAHTEPKERINFKTVMTWILFASVPSAMFIATTVEITQGIVAFPLIWIIPLALYLITFIVAFSGKLPARISFALKLGVLIFSFLSIVFTGESNVTYIFKITVYFINLLFVATYFHHELYLRRPSTTRLPFYYIMISIGGAIGSVVISIVAPLILMSVIEFSLLLIGVFYFIFVTNHRAILSLFIKEKNQWFALGTIIVVCMMLLFLTLQNNWDATAMYQSRNFYGALKVTATYSDGLYTRSLSNGSILHGTQFEDEVLRNFHTTYYSVSSGAGLALTYLQDHNPHGIRVGVIGLGAGTLATYCRDEDTFDFIDINPEIPFVAQVYFTFLDNCKNANIIVGDGRLALSSKLQKEGERIYDIILIDAFTDDAIPSHLLTREALAIYSRLLKEGGIITFHTSNRYIDLPPVVDAIGRDASYTVKTVNSYKDKIGETPSEWVLLSRNTGFWDMLTNFKSDNADVSDAYEHRSEVWTDDYGNILSILKLW